MAILGPLTEYMIKAPRAEAVSSFPMVLPHF